MRLSRGFTIIELTIVIAVVAIAMSLAVPSLSQARHLNEVKRVQSSLFDALNTARTEAITRSNSVTLCASSNGLDCDGNWTGWMVFQGPLPTGSVSEPLLVRLLTGVDVQTSATAITFSSLGTVSQTFLATLCDPLDAQPRAVHVSILGRPATSQDFDGDGLHDSPVDGSSLTCD